MFFGRCRRGRTAGGIGQLVTGTVLNQLNDTTVPGASRAEVCFAVGAFEVNPARNGLRLGEQSFTLEPLVMDLLCYLAEHAQDVVSRQELVDHVWFFNPDADESLTRAVSVLRRVFRHDRSAGAYIETFWKRGYALVAPTRFGAPKLTLVDAPPRPAVPELNTGYSVAVLPFHNQSEGSGDRFLADGITRDLTMLLSRVPRLRVAAYSSAARVDERRTPLSDIAGNLGVRYAVAGSLARHGDMFQVRAALMDADDDAQVWAQRIDAPLHSFFEVQDKLVLDVATSIISALQDSFCAAIEGRRPFQPSAYELVLQAEHLRLNYNHETAVEIVGLLDRALSLDPKDATVHAALAVQHTQNVVSRFVDSPKETFALARRHVETALGLAPQDPDVLAAAGIAATMMGNASLAVRMLRQAAALDPNNAHTLAMLGWQQCWVDGDAAGIEMIETAERRAPHHPRYPIWPHYRGHCHIRLGQVDQAIEAYRDCIDRIPRYGLNWVTMAAALSFAGRMDEARKALLTVHQLEPDYSCEDFEQLARRMVYWFGDRPSRDAMVDAMRRAWTSAGLAAAAR